MSTFLSTIHSRSSTSSSSSLFQHDRRIFIVVIVLGIVGVALVGFIIYFTCRLKKSRLDEASGPYEGTLVHPEHPAAQITPFGGGGPYSGRSVPQFNYTPGEDMRIAFRRPDGAWQFADSRQPFTPAGVKDIDVPPSPAPTSASFFSLNTKIPSNKEREVMAARDKGYGHDQEFDFPIVPPPPAYCRESCNEYISRGRSPV